MNIDERIQALTESVELLASFHRDTERTVELLVAEQREYRKENQGLLHEMLLAITRL